MIVPQEIYHPLYEDKEKFIILITGGRGSGKSFNASTFIERLTFEMTPVENSSSDSLHPLHDGFCRYVYHPRNDGEDRFGRYHEIFQDHKDGHSQ